MSSLCRSRLNRETRPGVELCPATHRGHSEKPGHHVHLAAGIYFYASFQKGRHNIFRHASSAYRTDSPAMQAC